MKGGNYTYSALADYKLYKLFGTPVKQQILYFLTKKSGKEFNILELNEKLDLPQSSLSVALKDLKDLGIVNIREEGKYRFFSLKKDYADEFKRVYASLEHVYAAALKDRAEKRKKS